MDSPDAQSGTARVIPWRVMALERVPADICTQGGVSRMSDLDMIEGIIEAVTIPVMAKAPIGHFVEARILQSMGVDYVDDISTPYRLAERGW